MRQSGLNQFETVSVPSHFPELWQQDCDYHNQARHQGELKPPVIQYSDGSYACWECHDQNRRGHEEMYYD
jgi:hypothetical protein